MSNGAFLPLLIQPACVTKGPDSIVCLESLPPQLQEESFGGNAALSVLLD